MSLLINVRVLRAHWAAPEKCAHHPALAHILWHIYHQAQNSLRFNGALPRTLNNWTRCNTTSIARPQYSYTSRCARGALTHSRDRINIQFPTSHYNSIKANLLLPLEHCFGWMLSGAPTPLWAQLRTFKHIKISQALHCPDYCLNIICFYILPLLLWLIFPLKLYPSVIPPSPPPLSLWSGYGVRQGSSFL